MSNRIMLNQTSYHGAGAVREIPGEVKSRGFKKALVVCGPSILKHGVVANVTDGLDAEGCAHLDHGVFPPVLLRSVRQPAGVVQKKQPVRKATV